MKKRFIVTLKNGNTYDMTVEEVDASAAVTVDAPAAPAAPKAAPAPAPKAAAAAGSVAVKRHPAGTVMKVNVKPGDTVTKGRSVAVIEALKMENDSARAAGRRGGKRRCQERRFRQDGSGSADSSKTTCFETCRA